MARVDGPAEAEGGGAQRDGPPSLLQRQQQERPKPHDSLVQEKRLYSTLDLERNPALVGAQLREKAGVREGDAAYSDHDEHRRRVQEPFGFERCVRDERQLWLPKARQSGEP